LRSESQDPLKISRSTKDPLRIHPRSVDLEWILSGS
jgi:hypothetical protein